MTKKIALDKDLYLFELDDVLFPKRDYILQVFYLFGSFYEYAEGDIKASEITQFMSKVYDIHGEDQAFLAAKTMFNIDDKYHDNYKRLMANAQLPVKLILFPEIDYLLKKLTDKKKKIAIFTKGNPVEQLNKLKYIDWSKHSNLKESLKVYFQDELVFRSINPLEFIAQDYGIDPSRIISIEDL